MWPIWFLVGCDQLPTYDWSDYLACDMVVDEGGGPDHPTVLAGLDPDGTTVICAGLHAAGHADGLFTGDVDTFTLAFETPVEATLTPFSDPESEVHVYLFDAAGEVLGTTADSGASFSPWRPQSGAEVTVQVAGYQGIGGAYALIVEAAPIATPGNVVADYETACTVVDGDVSCWGEWGDELCRTDGDITALEVGVSTVCGTAEDGAVRCWDRYGVEESLPLEFEGVVVSGYAHTHACAWDNLGAVTCWRSDADGTEDYLELPGTGWSHVRVGFETTCGLDTSGQIGCVGSHLTPPPGAFVDLAVSQLLACAIRAEDGSLACWYNPDQNGTQELAEAVPSDQGGYRQVVVGFDYACALRGAEVDCWGIGGPLSGTRFTSISGANSSACGVRDDGTVECWGFDRRGFVSDTP